jgi:hypothetical protein
MAKRSRLTITRLVLATCMAMAAWGLIPGTAAALDNRRPLVLVHGFEGSSSSNCAKKWGDLMTQYRSYGYKGPFLPVRYYAGDTACKPLSQYGAMLSPRIASGNNNTLIESFARHWAWFIYDNFSSHGQAVNVIAHSMGGLIVRYAIDAVQKHKTGFPPFIVAPSIVTFGTPHNGIEEFGVGCYLITFPFPTKECKEMNKTSHLIEYLRSNAQNPQGAYGTWWSVAGSDADATVDARSAVHMSVQYKMVYDTGTGHGAYMHQKLGDPFSITAPCFSTAQGADYNHLSLGLCYWPLQWAIVILSSYGY